MGQKQKLKIILIVKNKILLFEFFGEYIIIFHYTFDTGCW